MNYKKALEILEINSNDLDIKSVKRKYRTMALQYHPDKNPAPDAQERFQEIHTAYEYLLKYLNDSECEIEDDEYTQDFNGSYQYSYKEILINFLRGISEYKNEANTNTIFYNVIHKITEKCEERSLELISKLSKDLLLKTYDILYKHSAVFRISEDFVLKVQKIVEDRMRDDECIILNPTLDDLFSKNVYKLIIEEQTLLIPLWHHELVYEINGADIYVKCIPILPDGYIIDSENNLIIELKYNIKEIIDIDVIKIHVASFQYTIFVNDLRLMKRQQIVFNEGIPRIISGDIYNISKTGDIILDIHLSI